MNVPKASASQLKILVPLLRPQDEFSTSLKAHLSEEDLLLWFPKKFLTLSKLSILSICYQTVQKDLTGLVPLCLFL